MEIKYQILIVTKDEINSIQHAIEELTSLLEGADDVDYVRENKKHLKNLKMLLRKKVRL